MTGEKTWWKGDEAEYTGNSQMAFGGLFWELKLLEGHRKGQLVLTSRMPDYALTMRDRIKRQMDGPEN